MRHKARILVLWTYLTFTGVFNMALPASQTNFQPVTLTVSNDSPQEVQKSEIVSKVRRPKWVSTVKRVYKVPPRGEQKREEDEVDEEQKKSIDEVNNHANNGLEARKYSSVYAEHNMFTPELWENLNMAMGEPEIKNFLLSLPLGALTNLTQVARKNVTTGKSRLLKLMLDNVHKLKEMKDKSLSTPTPTSQLPSLWSRRNRKEKGFELGQKKYQDIKGQTDTDGLIYSVQPNIPEVAGVANPSTDMRKISEFPEESPKVKLEKVAFQQEDESSGPVKLTQMLKIKLAQKMKKSGKRNFRKQLWLGDKEHLANSQDSKFVVAQSQKSPKFIKNDPYFGLIPRNLNSLTVAGYFIPDLTTPPPRMQYGLHDDTVPNSTKPIKEPKYPWLEDKDPQNTYQAAHIDNFLKPPREIQVDETGRFPFERHRDQKNDAAAVAQQGFSMSQGSQTPRAPTTMSNMDGVLVAENSRNVDKTTVFFPDSERFQNALFRDKNAVENVPATSFFGTEAAPLEYTHSTLEFMPKKTLTYTMTDPNGDHNSYGNYEPTKSQKKETYAGGTEEFLNDDYYHYRGLKDKDIFLENYKFPQNEESDGVEKHPKPDDGGWGWNKDWWNGVKMYFKKGDKTTAEKIFEVSIAILSFLGFLGYILILLCQVLRSTSSVPLFPLFSSTAARSSIVLGSLFGRNNEGAELFTALHERKFSEDYINSLENIVKTAMSNVKEMLSSTEKFREYGGTTSRAF